LNGALLREAHQAAIRSYRIATSTAETGMSNNDATVFLFFSALKISAMISVFTPTGQHRLAERDLRIEHDGLAAIQWKPSCCPAVVCKLDPGVQRWTNLGVPWETGIFLQNSYRSI
jgi:hypothetical protein